MAKNLFSFDASRETPEMLAERRARAQALAEQIGGATTIGGGIGDIFRGLGAGLSRYRANAAQREGEATGRSAVDGLFDVLDQPQGGPVTAPGNDAVRESLKTGIATGTVPPLATYTPGGPQNAGQPDGRPRPYSAPPVAEAPPPVEEQAQAPMQPAPAPPAGPDRKVMAQMAAILRMPWVSEADKAIVRQRYEDLVKKSDPEYQYDQQMKRTKDALEVGKSKIELHNLQHPDRPMQGWTDPNTGDLYAYEPHDPAGTKVLVQKAGPKPGGEDDYKIIPKGSRVMKNGKLVDLGDGGPQPIEPLIDDPSKIQAAYVKSQGINRYDTTVPSLGSMYKSLRDPSAMSDLDFVSGVAKILDPTSSVREQEGQMIVNTQGGADQVVGYLNKMLYGKKSLGTQTRLNLFRLAARRVEEFKKQADRERSFYGKEMSANGYAPETYLPPMAPMPQYGGQNMQQPLEDIPDNAPGAVQAPASTAAAPVWVIDPVTKKPKRIQ